MKILAIIPAAEGLDTLPNRNMRILCGKPLIYYAINNAKESKYITDIIVTSNSDEVLTLVKQIGGARCYRRSKELSDTSVPLERVINDVRNITDFNEYEYIITMQSISVTLRHTTLDAAIEECLSKHIDTMISVSEKKKYFWKHDSHGFKSFQKQRVTKKQLDPLYVETGAFFISRPCYINDHSRIGGTQQLFVLSKDESIDIISFGDLKEAEYVLTKKRIAFFVNGNSNIGMGHIKRVLMLADEFFVKPTIFFDTNITRLEFFGDTSYEINGVDNIDDLIQSLKNGKYDLLINDVLQTSQKDMRKIRSAIPGIKLVNFEDDGDGAEEADLVINALYDGNSDEKHKIGSEYYVAPKLYLLQKPIYINDTVKNILVTFGGADPENYTSDVLSIIKDGLYSDYHFDVIIGPAKTTAISSTIEKLPPNVAIHRNVDGLVSLMRNSDMAICSRGRTGFELAICGIPSICMAQNEREERHNFFSEENGFVYLGFHPTKKAMKESIDRLLTSTREERIMQQEKMLRRNLRNGRKNIIDLINNV